MSDEKLLPMKECPHCLYCERALRAYRWRGSGFATVPSGFAEGRLYGGYGDGFFCSLTCGYRWAVQQARTLAAKGEG
jgi:hypothetical protein